MDPACDFLREYLPAKDEVDGVLVRHVRNCPECREEAPRNPIAGLAS